MRSAVPLGLATLGLQPLGLGMTRGGGGEWTPASLSPVIWLDRAGSGLFQDPFAVTAASTTDNPVGRFNDRSSNARHAVQEENTSRRPLVKPTGIQFDGSDDSLISKRDTTITSTSSFVVPDLSDSIAGKGFTNTGLTLDTSDDTFWVGNDGRSSGADVTHRPSLVNITKAGAFIEEIDLSATFPSATTIQGVAYDATDDSLWFCSTGENRVRNITKAGASVSTFTVTNANGIAIDTSDDSLLILTSAGISKYTKAGSLVSSFIIPESGDQLFYDAATSIVYYTSDSTSLKLSNVSAFHIPTKQLLQRWILPEAEHTEGIVFDDGVLYVCNDAFFHGGAGLNEILTYSLSPISYSDTAVVTLAAAFSIPSAPSGSRSVLAIQQGGSPRTGASLYVIGGSTTGLRVFVNSSDGTSQRDIVDFTSLPALTTARVVVAEVDTTANTVKLWLDGTQYGGTRSLTNNAGGVSLGMITLGAAGIAADPSASLVNSAVVYDRALTSDERTQLTAFLQARIA